MEMLVIAAVAIVAFAAVLWPLLRRRGGTVADDEREFATGATPDADAAEVQSIAAESATATTTETQARHATDDGIERDVLRYRDALRAGTLCVRCGQANPPGSAYCADCGKRLPLADAKEFA